MEVQATVFTDLVDSTKWQSERGAEYRRFLQRHLLEGREIARLLGVGTEDPYKKNIGDSHMAVFPRLQDALHFAVQMQQLQRDVPGLVRFRPSMRIGIGLGLLENVPGDAFGPGVNEAARVEGQAGSGEIVLLGDFAEGLRKAVGPADIDEYFLDPRKGDLKGLGTRELIPFDWELYAAHNADETLAGLVQAHLNQAGVELYNVNASQLGRGGIQIWPIVPRDLATAIHRGQAEVFRLLALLGWELTLLISDCAGANAFDRPYCERFRDRLVSHLARRGIGVRDCFFLSDMFAPESELYSCVYESFRQVGGAFRLHDIQDLSLKDLKQDDRDEIERNATALESIVPLLASAAVDCLRGQNRDIPFLVLAGADEKQQWRRTAELSERLGLTLIPILKGSLDGVRHQLPHKAAYPSFHSKQALINSLEGSSLGSWLFQLGAFLPAFPAREVQINGSAISPEMWIDPLENPNELDLKGLVDHVWELFDASVE